jgi:amino acid adenylation domain-containing protein
MTRASEVAELAPVDYDPFADAPLARAVPTTEAQREIWLACQLGEHASLAYNESVSLRFHGPLDATALRDALQGLVTRHEALRATISGDGQSLYLAEALALNVEWIDVSALTPQAREIACTEARTRAVEQPFDLEQGPLFRAELLALAPNDHILVLSAHHIVCDGWSFGVLVTELPTLYSQSVGQGGKSLVAACSFANYAVAQIADEQSAAHEADAAYWVGLFDKSVPVLELPTDRARKPVRGFASLREDMLLEAPLVDGIRRLGAAHGASLFVTIFGIFSALLARLSASDEVVVGVPSAGQAAVGAKSLVGHCVNLLPIRIATDLEQDVASLLRAANASVLDAYDHQHCTLGSLLKRLQVERDPGRLPLVSVLFNLDSTISANDLSAGGLRVELASNPRHFENFELFLNATQADGAIVLECQYNTDLFDASTVRRWLALYRVALQRAVAEPSMKVALALAPTPADVQTLAGFNSTQADSPRELRIEALIARQVAASADRIAVTAGEVQLSYRELDARANALAQRLRALGAGPGGLVGLSCGRNEHMIVGLLGILKSGAGYVPLDPAFPADRLEFMAVDARLHLVVTDGSVGDGLKLHTAQRVLVEDLAGQTERPVPMGSTSDVAYVIYTSGSTGRPKGVRVPHRTVTNLLESVRREPGMSARDTVLSVTTLSFDIAVSEVVLPLTVGAKIVIADREDAVDGDRLRHLVESEQVSFIDATPSTWRLLLSAGWKGSSNLLAICTGEPLPPDLGCELLPRVGQLWNGYGPTETTVWSTFHKVESVDGPVPIGRPIANTQIHVVDAKLRPVPVGVIGELLIGGSGVTLGYLERPELTAERFLPDPFSAEPGARLYRTGDLGRWRADGVLECLGRSDHQVKVRGYRIELGEIEANLLAHQSVLRALVVTREDQPGDVRLVAYLVTQPGFSLDVIAIQAHLGKTLPEYMVPKHFVRLPAIPLLPNGKIDRQALPTPEVSLLTKDEFVAPRNELELVVAAAMEEALRLPGISVHDNFFALGGHSLLAAQVATSLSQSVHKRVPMRAVFDAPTIARLADWLDSHIVSGPAGPAPIEARHEASHAPASLMQQRLWFLEQLDPGRVTYNTPSAHRLSGPMDVDALERSFNAMVRRQAILRTSIWDEAGTPVQRILPVLEVALRPVVDLSALPPAERTDRLAELLKARVSQPIDMREAPLFRIGLYKLAEEEHVLFFMPHHVIWDGWSFDLFYEEMAALYGAYSQDLEPTLSPLTASYADFSRWQQDWLASDDLQQQLAHWKQRFIDLPEPLALPLDRPRPARMTGGGGTEPMTCSRELIERARHLGQANEATLFMTLLAVYTLLLSRHSGQRDIVVGTPVRGRDSAQLENVMGFFVNALPLRLHIDPQRNFIELLAEVRAVVLDAFSAPDVPFEHLVQQLNVPREESRSPIYQAFFSFQDARQRARRWGALQQAQVHIFQPGAAEDLGLWFLEHAQGLAGGLSFNTDVFTAGTAARFAERFQCLLSSALADPLRAIGQLAYMPVIEQTLLSQWNRTEAKPEPVASVAALLQCQSRRTPGRTALRFNVSVLTYAELDARSNRLAHELRMRGACRGTLVGLCLNRSLDMLVAQLAILKSGAAYVPLDPAYPAERLAYMAGDAQLALLVTESSLLHAVDWPRERSVLLDIDAARIAACSDASLPLDPALDAGADDPAYVIYTSGSTGKPKGVVVPHGAVVNFLASMAREPGLVDSDRLLAVTTLSFDISVLELLLPLTVGAQVVLASREQVLDGRVLLDLLGISDATVMQATPSLWRMLIDAGWQGAPGFKALVGGEALPLDLAQQLRTRCAEVWNMYGPTETTVWSTCWRLDDLQHGISIGTPIANTSVWVLDEQRQLCPIGVPGELCIGGRGVSSGYLHQSALTAERFIPDPFSPGGRLYRTGDRGRWRNDGQLEHLGRLDFQVKLRGHRIELGEIEAAISSHPRVAQCVAIVREDTLGDARLVAYVVARGNAPTPTELRQHLQTQLPEYMLPQHVLALPALPLLSNGKINRKELPAPIENTTHAMSAKQVRLTSAEQAVADIWQEFLGVDGIRAEDNFFDLGGHSLLAMRIVMEMEKRLHMRVEVRRLIFESVAQIAATPTDVAPVVSESSNARTGLVSRMLGRFARRS